MQATKPTSKKRIDRDTDHPQERRARELVRGAWFIGVDGCEAAHFWSPVEQTVVVIEDDAAETVALADTPFSILADWVAYTDEERGWEFHRVGGSLLTDLRRGLDR
ncbi:hypothetical protein NDI85_19665 [Halomicroarcula sp. S1AR25-4]|uniref:hypothetical protein n=1 Tax=Haloarcula sp. S1AR25-4 TaxID=2950538 RepID=UPI002875A193|nr:hypothetical protein [Halomicroarcula sp. S1AR25-4]MDS0280006.1 hypothetical protein [Halomicroarcula sp. S1AR25-4]